MHVDLYYACDNKTRVYDVEIERMGCIQKYHTLQIIPGLQISTNSQTSLTTSLRLALAYIKSDLDHTFQTHY